MAHRKYCYGSIVLILLTDEVCAVWLMAYLLALGSKGSLVSSLAFLVAGFVAAYTVVMIRERELKHWQRDASARVCCIILSCIVAMHCLKLLTCRARLAC